MQQERLSLINYDVVRELCGNCRKERFHFVPIGSMPPATGPCKNCGTVSKLADISDSDIWRLMTGPGGEMIVVPLIAKSA